MKLLTIILLTFLPAVVPQAGLDYCLGQACSQTILPTPPECQKATIEEWTACICPHPSWAAVIALCIRECKPQDRGFVQVCPGGLTPFVSKKSTMSTSPPTVSLTSTIATTTTPIPAVGPAPTPATASGDSSSVEFIPIQETTTPAASSSVEFIPIQETTPPALTTAPSPPTLTTLTAPMPVYTGSGVTTKTFSDHAITISTRRMLALPTPSSVSGSASTGGNSAHTVTASGACRLAKLLFAGFVTGAAIGAVLV